MINAIAGIVGSLVGAYKENRETKRVEAQARRDTAEQRANIEVERQRGRNEVLLREMDINSRLDYEQTLQDRKSPFPEWIIAYFLALLTMCGFSPEFRAGFVQTLLEVPQFFTISVLAMCMIKIGGRGIFMSIVRMFRGNIFGKASPAGLAPAGYTAGPASPLPSGTINYDSPVGQTQVSPAAGGGSPPPAPVGTLPSGARDSHAGAGPTASPSQSAEPTGSATASPVSYVGEMRGPPSQSR